MEKQFFQFDKILLLGSRSPRRRELIRSMEIPFRPVDIPFDEEAARFDTPLELAKAKMQAYPLPLAPREVLLTADTMVMVDNQPLGKPKDMHQASAMLQQLSGRSHLVVSAVCMKDAKTETCFADTTIVRFKALSHEEICHYIHHYMPLDKAGAYGIQEWIGLIGITAIEGSYYTVMGLPTHLVWKHWLKFNGLE